MGRSGYSDDYDSSDHPLVLYRQAVENAINGRRGQGLLRRLRDALDALPAKRLIAHQIKDERGEVCALGALDPNAPNTDPDGEWDEFGSADKLAKHFGIARALAAEIVYLNDEWDSWRSNSETPEHRWERMRAWVEQQIRRDEDRRRTR